MFCIRFGLVWFEAKLGQYSECYVDEIRTFGNFTRSETMP